MKPPMVYTVEPPVKICIVLRSSTMIRGGGAAWGGE